MSCNVYVYDEKLQWLHPPSIELVASDQDTGATLDQAFTSKPLSEVYGTFQGVPANSICAVYAHDPTAKYAPATVSNLNGNLLTRVDMVLYPFPPSKSGTAHVAPHAPSPAPAQLRGNRPSHAEDINLYIDEQEWTDMEKNAVRELVSTFARLPLHLHGRLAELRVVWEQWVEAFNIDATKVCRGAQRVASR